MYQRDVEAVADVLRRRGVDTLVYSHCDHFEPWISNYQTVSTRNAEGIVRFGAVTEQIEYARKLSIFYRPHLKSTMDVARPGAVFAEDTPLGFVHPTEEALATARAGFGPLFATSAHELQLHIHHEHITGNDKYCHLSQWGSEFFTNVNTPEMDRRRLLLQIDLSLRSLELETGRRLDKWFFVHGNRALNGCDTDSCTINDEISLLMSRGCVGDFSFPACPPQTSINPVFEEPSFIRPNVAPRCYDGPLAHPRPAWGNGEAASSPDWFFVWSSPPGAYEYVELDYGKEWVAKLCGEPGAWANIVASKSLVRDGTLLFNTDAHSMHLTNRIDEIPVFPHEYGPIRSMFGILLDAATLAGARIVFETVSEVYTRIATGGVPALTQA